jgi:hypothetical protein
MSKIEGSLVATDTVTDTISRFRLTPTCDKLRSDSRSPISQRRTTLPVEKDELHMGRSTKVCSIVQETAGRHEIILYSTRVVLTRLDENRETETITLTMIAVVVN